SALLRTSRRQWRPVARGLMPRLFVSARNILRAWEQVSGSVGIGIDSGANKLGLLCVMQMTLERVRLLLCSKTPCCREPLLEEPLTALRRARIVPFKNSLMERKEQPITKHGGTLMKAAIYARVSTRDKGQDVNTQLIPLREYAQRRGFEVIFEHVDNG